MQAALSRGRERGLERAQISFMIGNSVAQHTYDQLGFDIEGERRDARFQETFGSPGMVTMVRKL